MKKTIALLLTLALAISAVALPALAEETGAAVDQVTSATQRGRDSQSGKGGRGGNRQAPGQNGTAPQAPDAGVTPQVPEQNSRDSQNSQAPGNSRMPQAPGQNGQNNQMPGNGQMPGGNNGHQGKGAAGRNGQAVKGGKQLIFDQLLSEGVITQEVYDAITAWINEKTQPQAETAAPAEGSDAPALPEGADAGTGSEQSELLKSLLDSGAITQEQYDLLAGAQPPAPAAPAAN